MPARVEKDKLGDALATQILERKALDHILKFVEIEEVHLDEVDTDVETLGSVRHSRRRVGWRGVGVGGRVNSNPGSYPTVPEPIGRPRTAKAGKVVQRVTLAVAVHELCRNRSFSLPCLTAIDRSMRLRSPG